MATPALLSFSISGNSFGTPGSSVTVSFQVSYNMSCPFHQGIERQSRDSSNGSSWGSWSSSSQTWDNRFTGTMTAGTRPSAGMYRQFRGRTFNADSYSSWIETGSVRSANMPTAPTSFTATPAIYSAVNVTLNWSGGSSDAATTSFSIQVSSSNDGTNWSIYSALTTLNQSASSGTYTYTPTNLSAFTRYRISRTNSLGQTSVFPKHANYA